MKNVPSYFFDSIYTYGPWLVVLSSSRPCFPFSFIFHLDFRTNMTITVIVDDNDPAIAYSGAWTALHPSDLGIKGINQSVGNSLHNTSIGDISQESFFSLNFSGNFRCHFF